MVLVQRPSRKFLTSVCFNLLQEGGDFALHVATRLKNTEIVKLLVENGANVNIQNVSYSHKERKEKQFYQPTDRLTH